MDLTVSGRTTETDGIVLTLCILRQVYGRYEVEHAASCCWLNMYVVPKVSLACATGSLAIIQIFIPE